MLYPVPIPNSVGTGGSSVNMNVGNMTNKGIEIEVRYRKMKGDFRFTTTGTFMANRNKVTRTNLSSGEITLNNQGGHYTSVIKEGYAVNTFWMIPIDGLVRTEEELAEYRKLVPTAKLGHIRMVDRNGDGVLNNDDRMFFGNPVPKWEGGLAFSGTYKGFDFNVQIYGTYGNKIYNAAKRNAYANKRHIDCLNAFNKIANTTTNIPAPDGNLNHENYQGRHPYFLEDGSYMRLRNVQIGYSLPRTLLSKVSISRCRFYLSGDNLFTFTRYTGLDPEVGGDGLRTRGLDNGYVPVTSTYRLGLQFDF